MAENRIITQVCIVVRDVKHTNENWSKVLGMPEEKIETIFPDGVLHTTHGKSAEYRDLQVAKYQLDGQGVFHVCVLVGNRKIFQQTLSDIGVGLPYHIGYHPNGSYSCVDAKEQLGIELSVNTQGDYRELFANSQRGWSRH